MALETRERERSGPAHPRTAASEAALARVYLETDRPALALPLWEQALELSGGPFLFGAFSIPDAYFAPVAGRIRTYGLPVSAPVAAWIERLWAAPGVAAWVADALAEQDFLDFEEPYRSGRG